MLYTECFTLRDCSGFLQIRSHIYVHLLCSYLIYLTDDETYLFLQLIQSKFDLLIILDRLCLSVVTLGIISVIAMSVKNHIGTFLILTLHIV